MLLDASTNTSFLDLLSEGTKALCHGKRSAKYSSLLNLDQTKASEGREVKPICLCRREGISSPISRIKVRVTASRRGIPGALPQLLHPWRYAAAGTRQKGLSC